ncbi:DegT/DnrJ/EryC1/StrS family aminotransferase [Thermogemmatispora sp.]|uniref:DegT/DnrJ/EryC1/StrS family aminotransferase n=1 Tax=Thermogemmatispora sp. TaxID=1968838 RepID=UPI001DEE79BC|nr:DegT/DnrJ/EryC1/StrS family aminotransferase [Thermogemmatispora sp.]MBX5451552.1 DegT/DnrJ/EryC1/StrS family aminotransferase [Thermogemmatispora sp.]
MIPIARPLLGAEEEAAIREVLASGLLAQGKYVAAFEQRFAELCQVGAAVAVSSGTAALQLALLAHGIGPGDEVITTAFSFVATANAILLAGATPVFVDIEPDTYTLDPSQVALALTERTRAILPVHLYGHPCDLGRLLPLAKAHNLILIEDACQAHASSFANKPVGSFGTGCFSFYATKNMTTGEGGMITCDDPEIATRLRLLRNHGQASRYHQVALGYNLRMTDLQGALGLAQLAKLEEFTQRRIANATYLNRRLEGIVQTPVTRPGYRHTYHQYTIRVPARRDEVAAELERRGIATAVHYPVPIHQQPFYCSQAERFYVVNPERQVRVRGDSPLARLPETERAAREVLSLPVHPALTQDELETIAREVIALCA